MTTLETTTNKTNDLRHSILSHDADGNPMTIKIRLNDECKNGHQDFSITAYIYEKGKPKTDRYFIAGGCCHDEIIKARPDLKIFVNLHLCDYEGIPTHAVANGFYHLTNGFNNVKPESQEFKAKFCDYYRITENQFSALSESKNSLQYALKLESLGILTQWKEEANEAIKLLESLTGKLFLVDSVKTQYHAPTKEEIKAEQTKIKAGYYTPEKEKERELLKIAGIVEKLENERDSEIKKHTEEFEVKKQVLLTGGESALSNCIYYTHSRTLSFNWKGYDRISKELYNKIAESIKLPEGVKIENKEK